MMHGFVLRLEGLYFTTFRKPTSTSLISSYTIPPYTTIRGVIANALGMRRDDLSLQDGLKIGINPIKPADRSKEMAKILKLKGDSGVYTRVFQSSPISKDFLIMPSYDIFLAGEYEKINVAYGALANPMRPLYIGSSDDLIDISMSKIVEVNEGYSKNVSGVVEGIHEGCIIEKIPFKFVKNKKEFSLEYKTISIPLEKRIPLKEDVKCWRFADRDIWLT